MQSKVIWGLTWKNSRKVTAFEVALKQSFVLKEYDEHNTEAYFDIENIDEWWSWFDEVQFKEFYQGPVPYDVVKNGAYNRMYVNNTFRYHNKLFGDPRIRIVRQNVFETDDARKPCRPDMYDEGILNDPRYTTPCFRKNIYDDITSETNDIRKLPFPGELKSILKFEQCTTWIGTECDQFIGTVSDVPASGYSVYLPLNNYTEASRIIRLLKANTAIMNLNTRAVAVEFIVYNPIVGMFSLVSLVTEMSVSGVVVPNAQFHTYQILPYTSYLWLQFLGECLIYAFFSSHIYSWYQEHVNLNLYRSSNLFMAIKNRYVKVVPKWFYLWVIPSKQVQKAPSFSVAEAATKKSRRLFERNDSAKNLKANTNPHKGFNGSFKTKERICSFDHSFDHVCKKMSTDPITGEQTYTFERHCTRELLQIPFTRWTLVVVESEVPFGWRLLRGYGNFFFDFRAYQLLMSIMFFAEFVFHVLQIVYYYRMLISSTGQDSVAELIKAEKFNKIQEVFLTYGLIVSITLRTNHVHPGSSTL